MPPYEMTCAAPAKPMTEPLFWANKKQTKAQNRTQNAYLISGRLVPTAASLHCSDFHPAE